MADKRAPNDAGESDDTGEPKLSAGRRLQDLMRPRTTAPKSMGLDDSWKAARNVTGSGFEPDEFEALPSFLRSRDPMTVPNTGPPRRSSFLAAFLRVALEHLPGRSNRVGDSHMGTNQIQDHHWGKGASGKWRNHTPTICVSVWLQISKPALPGRKWPSCTTWL